MCRSKLLDAHAHDLEKKPAFEKESSIVNIGEFQTALLTSNETEFVQGSESTLSHGLLSEINDEAYSSPGNSVPDSAVKVLVKSQPEMLSYRH